MIDILLEIESIDYEKSMEGLLPPIVKKCRAEKAPGELEKFIAKLGEGAVPAAKKLLGYMDGNLKDQLVVWMAGRYRDTLVSSANGTLEGLFPGGAVKVGDLEAEDRPGTRISLRASGVQIDYAKLTDSPLVDAGLGQFGAGGGLLKNAAKLALQTASRSNPEALEKQGIALLGSEKIKPKVMAALSEGIGKAGLSVTVGDLVFTEGRAKTPAAAGETKDEGLLPDGLEDAVLDALAAWMKDAAKK